MNFYIKKGLGSLAVLLFVLLLFVPTAAADQQRFTMRVTSGINGFAQMGQPFPVTVSLTNHGEDFQGDLVVKIPTKPSAIYKKVIAVQVAAGETTHVSFTVSHYDRGYFTAPRHQDLTQFQLYAGDWQAGDTVATPDVFITPQMIVERQLVIGVLSQQPEQLNYFKLPDFIGQTPKVTTLKAKDLPEQAAGLNMFDILVINQFPVQSLSSQNQQMLQTWLYDGGYLFVGSYPGLTKEMGILADELPLAVQQQQYVSQLPVLQKAGGEPLSLQHFSVMTGQVAHEAEVMLRQDQLPLVMKQRQGRGVIVQYSFNLGHPVFTSWQGSERWLQSSVEKVLPSQQKQKSFDPGALGALAGTFDNLSEVSFLTLFVLLFIFICVVLPLLYMFLKKIRRRSWSWIIIPLLAIIFSGALFGYGASGRIGDFQTRTLSIVAIDQQGYGSGVSGVAFLSQGSGDYKLQLSDELSLGYLPSDTAMNATLTDIPAVQQRHEQLQLLYPSVAFWTPHQAVVQLPVQDYGGFVADITYAQGKITGQIKNTFAWDLQHVMLWNGSYTLDIGAIASGDTTHINLSVPDHFRVQPPFAEFVPINAPVRNDMGILDRIKQRLKRQAARLGMFPKQSPVLIGWSRQPIYTVQVNGETTEPQSLNVFVMPVTIQHEE